MHDEILQGQMNIFDFISDSNGKGGGSVLQITKDKKVRLIELFAG